jgi:uncharacterized protein (PEP-CTERM system associated)
MLLASVSAGVAMTLAPARADGLLPAYGADVRVGDLRKQFDRTSDAGPRTVTDRVWTFSPGIGITETYDSAVPLSRGRGADYITRITPIFAGTVDAQRLKGSLNYSPSFNYYAVHGSQNGLSHNLNTNATATLVPDLLFANLNGYATTQPLLGTYTPATGSSGRVNEVQVMNFSAGPYIQKRFGDFATVNAGYTVSRTSSTSLAPKSATPTLGGATGNFSSQQENASVVAGPDFGRINGSLAAMATQYDGVGVYRGAHNETVTASAGYAISRTVTATGSVGHETIIYGPGGPKAIDGITWSGGVVLTPNADSSITAKYGHQQGSTSFSFDGSYAVTQRMRISARYSQGVGTSLQNLQSALAGTTSGPAGFAVDQTTGAPVQLGSLLNQQPGVYRTTIASVSAAYRLDRDTLLLDWSNTERVLLSGGTGTGFGSSTGMNVSASWQHLLSENLNASTNVQHDTRSYPGFRGESNTLSVSVSLNYTVSETITTNLLVSHSETTGQTFGLAPVRDLVVVGLRKTF